MFEETIQEQQYTNIICNWSPSIHNYITKYIRVFFSNILYNFQNVAALIVGNRCPQSLSRVVNLWTACYHSCLTTFTSYYHGLHGSTSTQSLMGKIAIAPGAQLWIYWPEAPQGAGVSLSTTRRTQNTHGTAPPHLEEFSIEDGMLKLQQQL